MNQPEAIRFAAKRGLRPPRTDAERYQLAILAELGEIKAALQGPKAAKPSPSGTVELTEPAPPASVDKPAAKKPAARKPGAAKKG